MYLRKRNGSQDDADLISIVSRNFDVSSEIIERIITQAQDIIVVCDDNDKIAGFASYRYRIGHMVYIDYVALDEKYQGKGLASSLLPAFVEYMKKQGIRTIYGTVDAENEDALNTLKKWGFQEKGQVLSSIVIQKNLTENTKASPAWEGRSCITQPKNQRNNLTKGFSTRRLQAPPPL